MRGRTPTDDEIWRLRHVGWGRIARIHGVRVASLTIATQDRGWIRSQGNQPRIVAAPCATCGEATPVGELNAERQCAGCLPVTMLRRERELYLERRAEEFREAQAKLRRLQSLGYLPGSDLPWVIRKRRRDAA